MYYFNPTLTQFNAPYGMGVYGMSFMDYGPVPLPDTGDYQTDVQMAEAVVSERMEDPILQEIECPYGKYKTWTGMNWVCQEPLPEPPKPQPKRKDPKDDAIKLSTVLLVATPVFALVGFLMYRKYN